MNVIKTVLTYLIVMILLIGLQYCKRKSTDELLIGKWVFNECEYASDSNLKPLTSNEKSRLEKTCITNNLYFIFSKDKTFESNYNIFSYRPFFVVAAGTYEIVEDGKYTTLHYKSKENQLINDRIKILSLSENILKVNIGERFIFIYKRIIE